MPLTVANMTDTSEAPTRHPVFYFENGTVIQVERTLYKIYPPMLVQESDVFASLFEYGSTAVPTEGETDESPIFLPGLCSEVFNLFVEFKFGR